MAALGEEFRAARETRGLSLTDVSEQIHIRSTYLQSIEDENWAGGTAPVYMRGFIRTYARFLGLDPALAIERFDAAIPARPAQVQAASRAEASPRKRPSPWLYLASTAAVVLVFLVGYNYVQVAGPVPPVVEPSAGARATALAATPVPATTHAPGLASQGALGKTPREQQRTFVVRLVERSWLRVDIDGAAQMVGIYPAGTQRVFHGRLATLRVGNAGGVDVSVNGKDVGKLGAAGDVVQRTFTLAQE